jgi:transposase
VGQRQSQSYSDEFKDSVRAKILNRGDRSIAEICAEAGVKYSTADNWVRSRVKSLEMKKQKSSVKWSPEQKLNALIVTASLSEAELGAYLRKEGLFTQQLDEWKKEILSSMATLKPRKNAKDDRDQKIKMLEREVLRKDKALAEASALLILQKKVNLIWGKSEEEEK